MKLVKSLKMHVHYLVSYIIENVAICLYIFIGEHSLLIELEKTVNESWFTLGT